LIGTKRVSLLPVGGAIDDRKTASNRKMKISAIMGGRAPGLGYWGILSVRGLGVNQPDVPTQKYRPCRITQGPEIYTQ
jgi:hypothetical protein